jgi:hypothetical protein
MAPLFSDGGLVTMICVPSLFTLDTVAFAEPKETLVSLVKPVPVIVTVVPPAIGPWFGSIFVTTGAGGGVGQVVDSVALGPEVLLNVSVGFEQ